MTEVVLTGLVKTYRDAAAPSVGGLSLTVAAGELTALLGPSGCGKTTALKMIAGLMAPDAGDIRFDGQSVLRALPEARGAVMVFQNQLLFPFLTVAENVGFGLKMRKTPLAETRARVEEMLERVHLPGLGARRPAELSGGQAQRVALARALVLRPRVLLLDEPLSNLDAGLRAEMRDLIRTLQRQTGITTIVVTHDQEEAVVLADRIALMLQGRLSQHATPEEFFARPANPEVARFFGGQNFLPGRSDAGRFQCALGSLTLSAGCPDGAGILTIRPEELRLGPGANTFDAILRERQFLGTQVRLHFQFGTVMLQALMPPDQAQGLSPGDIVALHLPPSALWVM